VMSSGMDDITATSETTSIKRDRGGRVVIGGKRGRPSNMQLVNRDLG
jgi:hypothetical protein